MASPIQLIQIGTTAPSIVTCHPRRRRTAWSRAIRKKSTAVTREKVRCVIFNLRRTCGQTSGPGRLLSRLLPYQPVHCFLPGVEPGEFASGEGLQRLVEDVG